MHRYGIEMQNKGGYTCWAYIIAHNEAVAEVLAQRRFPELTPTGQVQIQKPEAA